MTIRKILIAFATMLMSLAAVSCQKKEPAPEGIVTLTFSTGQPVTRAVTPGDGSVLDGGGIVIDASGNPDLIIAIANKSGSIIAWYPDTDANTLPNSLKISSHTASEPDTEATIRFTGIDKGTYSVYALANTANLASSVTDAVSAAATLADLKAIKLTDTGTSPAFATSMPLSAQGSVSVNDQGTGQVDLEMLRVVGKVSLTFKNLTEAELALYNCQVTLNKMNPSQGFLFPQDPDYVSGVDRNLVFSNASLTIPVIDPDDDTSVNTALVGSPLLVFPSTAPAQTVGNRYLCDVSFRVAKPNVTYDAGDSNTYTSYSFTSMPVHDRRSADIPYLLRNQHLKIETSIAKKTTKYDISFNFVVNDWTERTEEVLFH